MGRIVVTEFISLDGVVEDPGGSEDFKHGGWSFEFSRGPEGDKFKVDETMASDALLLGRVTYEGFAAAWPSRDGEFADRFNSMPKYVVSSTLSDPEWTNSTVLDGDVAEEVAKLREKHDRDIVVHGSVQLAQTLLENDLVDELRLMVFPVVLGSGKRLFGETSDKKPLRLADSKTVGDGVAILVYERARPTSAAASIAARGADAAAVGEAHGDRHLEAAAREAAQVDRLAQRLPPHDLDAAPVDFDGRALQDHAGRSPQRDPEATADAVATRRERDDVLGGDRGRRRRAGGGGGGGAGGSGLGRRRRSRRSRGRRRSCRRAGRSRRRPERPSAPPTRRCATPPSAAGRCCPVVGAKPLLAISSVPPRLAAPPTASTSYVVPGVVPAISMRSVPPAPWS